MPTTQKKIFVYVDDTTFNELNQIKQKTGNSLSSIVCSAINNNLDASNDNHSVLMDLLHIRKELKETSGMLKEVLAGDIGNQQIQNTLNKVTYNISMINIKIKQLKI